MQLLRDRAAAVRPGFAVTDDNVASIVEICRRLDGLPLAIELAAARLRTLSPEQVAAGLDDRFRLLTGGSRTALPRHRTLRAVVAWSWDLLTEDERRLADALAVFPSTITADSAAGVAGAGAPTSTRWWTSRCSRWSTTGASGCWRRSASTGWSGWPRPAAWPRPGPPTRRTSCGLVETADPHLRTAGQLPWLRLLRGRTGKPQRRPAASPATPATPTPRCGSAPG